jgi:hypothetical protein
VVIKDLPAPLLVPSTISGVAVAPLGRIKVKTSSKTGSVALEIFLDALAQICPADFSLPTRQKFTAHGSQTHPFGETLAVNFAPQDPKSDHPVEVGLGALRSEGSKH